MTDPVNKLVEEMEATYRSQPTRDGYYCGYPISVCKDMLRIVLSAIQRGEVVDMEHIEGCADDTYKIVLQPEFKQFLEEK